MRTTPPRRSSPLRTLLASAALASLSGCQENWPTLYIRSNQAAQLMGTTCTVSTDPSSLRVFEGSVDLSARNNYVMSPLFQSNFIARADPQALRSETNTVVIQGFVVELRIGEPSGNLFTAPFSVYQTTVVPPGAGGQAGFAATTVEVIPPAVMAQLRSQVCVVDLTGVTPLCPVPKLRSNNLRLIVRLVAFGRTVGGVDVETPPFDFPVTAQCGGTFVHSPPDMAVPTTMRRNPTCNTAGMPLPGDCNPGQDGNARCGYCQNSVLPLLAEMRNAPPELAYATICQPRGWSPDPNYPTCTMPGQTNCCRTD